MGQARRHRSWSGEKLEGGEVGGGEELEGELA